MLHPLETTIAAVWLLPALGRGNRSTKLFPTEVSLAVVRRYRTPERGGHFSLDYRGNLHRSCRRIKRAFEENSGFSTDSSFLLKS